MERKKDFSSKGNVEVTLLPPMNPVTLCLTDSKGSTTGTRTISVRNGPMRVGDFQKADSSVSS